MSIASPKTSPDSHGHVLECEFVMEPFVELVADLAEAAGWSPETVALALCGLAATRLEAIADARVNKGVLSVQPEGH